MKITAIIPLRVTPYLHDARDRLDRIVRTIPRDKFSILIVDYGTPADHRAMLEFEPSAGVDVVSVDAQGLPFSIGHARDIGVQHAGTDVVMFHDIDFACSTAMYERIHTEVVSRQMAERAYDFFCVPVFFLTEHGSRIAGDFLEREAGDHELHAALYNAAPGVTEFPAYGSSAIVANKWHYLGMGGHSREFYGHGAEDYDLLHRLCAYAPKGPRTKDYYVDTKSNSVAEYRGFRAYFALRGLDVFARGVYMIHLWHPKREIPGYQQSNRNFQLLKELMVGFDRDDRQPIPLPDLRAPSRVLVLMDYNAATLSAVRHALPLMGHFEIQSEANFAEPGELVGYCRTQCFDRIVFLNPYGNPHRLALYRTIRSSKIAYFVFDRGALPDSWFFDPNGFNFDSSSYHPAAWDVPLPDQDVEAVDEYIQTLRNGEEALEANGPRKSGRFLREHLGIGNRRVLFVPFQRPSDTVTNYFAGAAGSVAQFQAWVDEVTKALPAFEWAVVCKNHPLDPDLPRVENAIYVDGDTHVNDLLDLADAVLLMNSGVGVIALAFGKPVICTAEAFYAHPGLAYTAKSPGEVLDLLRSPLAVDTHRVRRFYRHLLKVVYSFGTSKYRSTRASDGSARSIVQRIVFRNVNLGGLRSSTLGTTPAGVSLDAPLFASFGGRDRIKHLLTRTPVLTAKGTPGRAAEKKLIATLTTSMDSGSVSTAPQRSPGWRKLRKLVKHPHAFFRDYFAKKKGHMPWAT